MYHFVYYSFVTIDKTFTIRKKDVGKCFAQALRCTNSTYNTTVVINRYLKTTTSTFPLHARARLKSNT